jgi:hypothetical protein
MSDWVILKNEDGTESVCVQLEMAVIQRDNDGREMQFVRSFQAASTEEAFEIFNAYNVEPELADVPVERLVLEIHKLRQGIRRHRDAAGHQLCWYVPELWDLTGDVLEPKPEIPPTEEFLKCCREYRKSLDIVK